MVEIIQSNLLDQDVDAIVCPAHKHMIRGRGLSAQIFDRGGEPLANECRKLYRCDVGEAHLTHAYNLPAKYILHTVTPQWSSGDQWGVKAIELLRKCYESVLTVGLKNNIASIALPALGAGTNRTPHSITAHVGLEVLHQYERQFDKLICCLRSSSALKEWQDVEKRFFRQEGCH